MIFRVSTQSKRIVGRLDAGDDLVDVLTGLCDRHDVAAADIRAVGQFEAIELVHFNAAAGEYEPLVDGEGHFELVSLNGNAARLGGEVALRLNGVFNAVGPAGAQTIGGQLRSARALSGEFVIEVFSDLRMQRRLDADTGRLVLDEIDRRESAAASAQPSGGGVEKPAGKPDAQKQDDTGGSMSWDDAIAEAQQTEQRREKRRGTPKTARSAGDVRAKKDQKDPYADFDFDEPLMSTGDMLDHPKLGKCRIIEVEDDQYVKVRLPRGRIRKLAMSVLEIEYRGEEDDKKVFEAKVKR